MPILKVTLLKISNLSDEDWIGKSDPYVKFEVYKDNWFSDETKGTATSTKKSGECNPEYNEEFVFMLEELGNRVLKVTVMDDDVVTDDDKLGEAKIELDKQDLTPGEDKEIEVTVDDNWSSKDAKATLILNWEGE